MNIEEIKKNAPDGATHYRKLLFFIQYFRHNEVNGFWYQYENPFWLFFDAEKPVFIKPL